MSACEEEWEPPQPGLYTRDDWRRRGPYYDVLIDVIEADQAPPDGFGYGETEEEGGENGGGGRRMANLGDSTRVETTVAAMLLAES